MLLAEAILHRQATNPNLDLGHRRLTPPAPSLPLPPPLLCLPLLPPLNPTLDKESVCGALSTPGRVFINKPH
jgi:hypothetical protein